MEKDTFLLWMEERFTVAQITKLLISFGICDETEIIEALEDYIMQLQDVLAPEED